LGYNEWMICSYGMSVYADSRLYYFNARWYDADTGRFITEDPARDGLLWYAYANNNPLKFTDPTGMRAARGSSKDDEDDTRKADEKREEKEQKKEERKEYIEKQKQELNDSLDPYKDILDDLKSGDVNQAALDALGVNSVEDIPAFLRDVAFAVVPAIGAAGIAEFVNIARTALNMRSAGNASPSSPKTTKEIEVPEGWEIKPSKKGGGTKYTDPNNRHNNIREMPGNPNSPNTAQQEPYVIFKKEGTPYDVNGNPLKNADDPAAHIPRDLFDMSKMPKF